jgi:hypothetical protein
MRCLKNVDRYILNHLEHATALLGGHGFRPLVLQTLYTLSDDQIEY